MKYAGLIKEIKDILLPVCGEYADYEAGKIVRLTAETDSARLFAALHDEVPPNVVKKSEDIAKKRLRGEPLEYIIKNGDAVEVFIPCKVSDFKKYVLKKICTF